MNRRRLGALMTVIAAVAACSSASAGDRTKWNQYDHAPVYSPDGKMIAFLRIPTGYYVGPEPHLAVMRLDTGEVRDLGAIPPGNTTRGGFSWAPDSRELVFNALNAHEVQAIRTDGSGLRTLGPGSVGNSTGFTSPDGLVAVVAAGAKRSELELDLMRLDGSERHTILTTEDPRLADLGQLGEPFRDVVFTRDGAHVTFTYGETVWRLDRSGSDLERMLPGTGVFGLPSPDGDEITYERGGDVYVVDGSGATRLVVSLGRTRTGLIGWTPDEKQLLVHTATTFELADVSDGSLIRMRGRLLQPAVGFSSGASWSPDGKSVVLDGRVEGCYTGSLILATATLGDPRILTGDCRIFGTAHADRIVGGELNDIIHGRGGDDRLFGGEGHDTIYGDGGNDLLDAGVGNDRLEGGPGQDRLLARDGYGDVVDCGAGVDTAVVDRWDVVRHCERVLGPRSRRPRH
jgi:hypothetical protein